MDALHSDPVMDELVEEHGELELVTEEDPFRRLAVAVVNQQLSTASAAAIRERLTDVVALEPDVVLTADEGVLRDTGMSRQKVDYLKNLAAYFSENGNDRERFRGMADGEVVEELTSIKGIGVWTVKMFLIFCLGREDVFPVEDLGIRRAMEELYGLEEKEEMVEKSKDWRPCRSYASRYLWRSVD